MTPQRLVVQQESNASSTPLTNGKSAIPATTNAAPAVPKVLREWDAGVFSNQLVTKAVYPGNKQPIKEGTFSGTSKALTEMYKRIENRFASYYDIAGFESSVRLDEQENDPKSLYKWSTPGPKDPYTPHLDKIPHKDDAALTQIFNKVRLIDTASLLVGIIPAKIVDWAHGSPDQGTTFAELEQHNAKLRSSLLRDDGSANIGDRKDWFADAVFAQQRFTGTNPCAIEAASAGWQESFAQVAAAQKNTAMQNLIRNAKPQDLWIVDHRYFRQAFGVAAHDDIHSEHDHWWSAAPRYCPATVTLYSLSPSGSLHPLAICIDYKEKLSQSVVIFNKRLTVDADSHNERVDWPWRYAKTCAQISDWVEHEVGAHLVNTHFVEEATIVAASRAFTPSHPVYKLLSPHWIKTLPLNAAARATLVPHVIAKVTGCTTEQTYAWMRHCYAAFDFQRGYVPAELASRGFNTADLAASPAPSTAAPARMHNYAYGRNVLHMWDILRRFVATYLSATHPTDASVAHDAAIATWSREMQAADAGQMPSFPTITTVAQLVDACTMCIHVAAVQHTAVNYTQDYYQSFVPNKPPALFAPPPKSLDELLAYGEADVCRALPVHHPREWLLASHLPHLLTFRVAEDQTLINYALSLQKVAEQDGAEVVLKAAETLWKDLAMADATFARHNVELDDKVHAYSVFDSREAANSILI